MKCDDCGKRMRVETGEITMSDGVRVVNAPVRYCPECGRRAVHDLVLLRAKSYVNKYETVKGTLDYGKCEQQEDEEALLVMSILGMI